jgi:hypothetical protein
MTLVKFMPGFPCLFDRKRNPLYIDFAAGWRRWETPCPELFVLEGSYQGMPSGMPHRCKVHAQALAAVEPSPSGQSR